METSSVTSKTMSKAKTKTAAAQRSPERDALADAIRVRDEDAERVASVRQMRGRLDQELPEAIVAVDRAEEALKQARERERAALVDAYATGGEPDRSATAEAEAALGSARARLADLRVIATTLEDEPRACSDHYVEAAVRAVVAASPTVRRMVEDYDTARRTFQVYHSTLRWLASCGMIPDSLEAAAPQPHHPYYVEPDPAWATAVERLARDPDASLPGE